MRTESIRFIDAYVGRPLCFVLTVLRRLGKPIGLVRPARSPVRRICFVKLVEQGATVLAYEAIRRARELVGRENVFFCVFEQNREVIDALDLIAPENVITIREDSVFHFLTDAVRAAVFARRNGIDAMIDMEFFARGSAILCFMMGGSRRVGLHRFDDETPYRGDLLTHRVPYNPHLHTAEAYALLVEALGRDPDERPLLKVPMAHVEPELPPHTPAPERVENMRRELEAALGHEPGRPIVFFNPNPVDPLFVRKWPAENYEALAERIRADHPDASFVLIGMPYEREGCEAVREAIGPKHVANMAGKTRLSDLLALYTFCDVLVTNDSGAAHFASVMDVPQVVFFGPETPALFSPLGQHTRVLYKQLACSPCLNAFNHRFSVCRDNVCVRRITVDEVYERVEPFLAARQGGRER